MPDSLLSRRKRNVKEKCLLNVTTVKVLNANKLKKIAKDFWMRQANGSAGLLMLPVSSVQTKFRLGM